MLIPANHPRDARNLVEITGKKRQTLFRMHGMTVE